MASIPQLQELAEKYYPKRNNAAKKRVADAIIEAKSKGGPATRHTGTQYPAIPPLPRNVGMEYRSCRVQFWI